MTVQERFNVDVPARLAAHPVEAAALNTVIRFATTGDGGGEWTLRLQGDTPTCLPYTPSDDPDVQVRITLAGAENFESYMTSRSASMQMLLDKRLIVTGVRAPDALKLRTVLSLGDL